MRRYTFDVHETAVSHVAASEHRGVGIENLAVHACFGETDAICVEALKNPATEEGVLLKVMARGPFEQGQQVWILDRDGSKVGATVDNVSQQTIDSELTLSTVLPA